MNTTTTRFGKLTCRVVDRLPAGQTPSLLVVLCHGFGAPGDDLVSMADELLGEAPTLIGQARFVFPEAPLSLDAMGYPGARAWWPLDVERLGTMVAQGRLRDLSEEVPEGLDAARRQLRGALDALTRHARLPMGRVVLGGFSQGAMLTTDTTLRLEEAPAALAVLSGTVLAAAEWRKRAPRRRGLRVLQSHGRQDPLLPFFGAEALRDLLTEAGLAVDFVPFHGQHTIPGNVVRRLASLLTEIAKR